MDIGVLDRLNIELSSACNLRCRWCNLDHTKSARFMDLALFEKVLNEISRWSGPSLWRISLHNGGETLLHPEIMLALDILTHYRPMIHRETIVGLLTNGTMVHNELADELSRCEGLDEVRFSIDGGSPAEFESIRKGTSWERVSSNFRSFVGLVGKTKSRKQIGIICVVPLDRQWTTSWMDPEFVQVLELADHVEIRHPHHMEGTQDIDGTRADPGKKVPERLCKFLMKNLVVLYNGQVTVCCADLNERGNLGNIKNKYLWQLWHEGIRIQMLDFWRRGLFDRLEPCRTCEGYYEQQRE